MTWAKYGTEFFDQLVDLGFAPELDDACQLTHAQAVHYCYSVESTTLTFRKNVLRRFATSARAEDAAAELVKRGAWRDHGSTYEVVHHAEVMRQSLGYQLKERDRSRKAKAAKRAQDHTPVSTNVPQDVTRDGMRPQTDRQSFNQSYEEGSSFEQGSSLEEADQDFDSWVTAALGDEGQLSSSGEGQLSSVPGLPSGMSECGASGCSKVVESDFCTFHADELAGRNRLGRSA